MTAEQSCSVCDGSMPTGRLVWHTPADGIGGPAIVCDGCLDAEGIDSVWNHL